LIGLPLVLIAGWRGDSLSLPVLGLSVVSSAFMSLYFFSLMMGYRTGNFSVVYPVARSLPILLLACVDIVRGALPSRLGWLGIAAIVSGCVLIPLTSVRRIKLADYWNRTTVWILVIALATVGYTTVDKIAAELLVRGGTSAAHYALLQGIFTVPFLWLAFKWAGETGKRPEGRAHWIWVVVYALLVFSSHWLMLWAFQLAPSMSYLTALRQFSLIIGVAGGVLLFREPAPLLRVSAAVAITAGILCISQAP
jgi:drug/metabolite transporter (DMT)-like permease